MPKNGLFYSSMPQRYLVRLNFVNRLQYFSFAQNVYRKGKSAKHALHLIEFIHIKNSDEILAHFFENIAQISNDNRSAVTNFTILDFIWCIPHEYNPNSHEKLSNFNELTLTAIFILVSVYFYRYVRLKTKEKLKTHMKMFHYRSVLYLVSMLLLGININDNVDLNVFFPRFS